MNSRGLYWAVAVILMIILVAVIMTNYQKPGIFWPMLLLEIVFVGTAIAIDLYKPRKAKAPSVARGSSLSVMSKLLGFCFLPGNEFFSEDMDAAIKQQKDGYLSKTALVLIVAIVAGFSFLSPFDFFKALGITAANWELSTNPRDWAIVYVRGGLVFMFLTMAINLIVKLAVLQQSVIGKAEKLDSLIAYFQLPEKLPENSRDFRHFWDTFSQHLDNIFGHKTWGGPKMYELLQQITINKNKIGTSHWFLLQFAADTLDHHVLKNKVGLFFTYDDDAQYSEFLARSMTYCTKSMIWVVDRSDFDKELFPSIVREVLFSLACELDRDKKGIGHDLSQLKENALSHGLEKVMPHSEHLCEACNEANGGRPCDSGDNENTDKLKCRDWKEVLSCYLRYWASVILEQNMDAVKTVGTTKKQKVDPWKDENEKNKIWKSCDDRETDRFPYPHLRTYYDHMVPKSRIIDLGQIGGWLGSSAETRSQYVITRLCKVAWPDEKEKGGASSGRAIDKLAAHYICDYLKFNAFKESDKDDEAKKHLKKIALRHCFLEAWNLFQHLSNSGSNQVSVGFAPLADKIADNDYMKDIMLHTENPSELIESERPKKKRMFMDIGIYDKSVMVNSCKDGKRRVVRWTLLPDGTHVFDGVYPSKGKDNAELLKLTDFVAYLEEVVKIE